MASARNLAAPEEGSADEIRCVLGAVDTQQYPPQSRPPELVSRAFHIAPAERSSAWWLSSSLARASQTLLEALPAVLAEASPYQSDVPVWPGPHSGRHSKPGERIAAVA